MPVSSTAAVRLLYSLLLGALLQPACHITLYSRQLQNCRSFHVVHLCPRHAEFLGATAGLVDALGRKGLNLLKERTECLDPSCHPGFRAAALAYASCAVAMILQGTPAFPSRQEVLMDIIEAGFGLAPLFGEPGGVEAIVALASCRWTHEGCCGPG